MDKANIIISIIIVLCIAAAVAAYGLTNSADPVFSDLSSMSADSNTGSGIGNNTTTGDDSGISVSSGSSSDASSGSSNDYGGGSGGPDSGSSSSDDSSSSSDDSGSSTDDSGSDSSSSTQMSYSDAESIASGAIAEEGCYIGGGYYSDGYWYFTVYDENGTDVDVISVDDATGSTGRG